MNLRPLLCLLALPAIHAQPAPDAAYVLGPDDQLLIRALDTDEIKDDAPFRVDSRGFINVPLAGRVHAAGLTVEQLEAALSDRLREWLQRPTVTVSVAEFRSQPVSVLGAVGKPGVVQIRGRKTLYEVLSLAEGLRPDAGNAIRITRDLVHGPIPLPTAKPDPTGRYTVAEVRARSVMEGGNPQENIVVQPDDVISVPKADLVYVIGCVKRAGGFVLNEKESISVLQALALAEGTDHGASEKGAKILRPVGNTANRDEIPLDLKRILAGQSQDVQMQANDILFVPTSAPKNAALRGLEAAISIGTGVVIYRR